MASFLVLSLVPIWVTYRILRRYVGPSSLHNVPGPPPESLLFGSLPKMMNIRGWDFHRFLGDTYPHVAKLRGFLGNKFLYDQDVYEESEIFIAYVITIGPVLTRYNIRVSTSGVKITEPQITEQLQNTMLQIAKEGPVEVDVMEWMTRTAMELIGQSGLGYSFDSLVEGSQPHPYAIAAKPLVPLSSSKAVVFTTFLPFLSSIGTPKFQRFIVNQLAKIVQPVRMMRDIVDVLHKTSIEIYESKKQALREGDEAVAAQIGRGKDIISILMKANIHASDGDRLSETELIGQITSLTFAATDTTSTALARTIHLLSEHKDVQDRLREELKQSRIDNNGQDLSYDTLVQLPYLDAICRETLRFARQEMALPLSNTIKGNDGSMLSEITVPKGTDVFISIITSNRNVDLWGPDAHEWKPERWLQPLPEELVKARIPGIYSRMMTFLGGGRSCMKEADNMANDGHSYTKHRS
ncbi:cytochrome P450 [Panaeolus papilionaceus]|nr:cytochrome P450 [Panaeolus papilionaceus]